MTAERVMQMKVYPTGIVLAIAATIFGHTAIGAMSGDQIIDAAGLHGGFVIHVGCGDGRLTAELLRDASFLVQGLEVDPALVRQARRHLQSLGIYGRASVIPFDGHRLPYVDGIANLIVLAADCDVPEQEIQRVLCPGGHVIRVPSAVAGIESRQKPRPDSIDDWTHFLHGPDNNAVAEDTEVGPPRHMQWLAGPLWTRHHHSDKGTDPTIRSVVSAAGRLYYMIDTAGTSDMTVPSEWHLAARDAFSGVLLWSRPLPINTTNRRLEQVWRGLIADKDSVYAPLGAEQPLAAIDGATGQTVRRYDGTAGMQEVIKCGSTLFVITKESDVLALDSDSGDRQWEWTAEPDDGLTPLTMAASEARVCVRTAKGLHCLSASDGQVEWQLDLPTPEKQVRLRYPHEKLIIKDGVVLCSYGGKDPKSLDRDSWEYLGSHPRVREYDGRLGAFAIEDGRRLWESPYNPGLESMPGEVYVSDGQVWLGPDFTSPRDLQTGRVVQSRPVLDRLWTSGHHYRCYPGKATCNYIITAKRGIELIDMAGDQHSRNNWVRATCRVGVTPCNGLIYAPPHSCGCYMEAKLFGFWALKGETGDAPSQEVEADPVDKRLLKGPAYGIAEIDRADTEPQPAWSTYRGDAFRSASLAKGLPAELAPKWNAHIGGPLSGLTVDENRLYVAQIETHTVVALNVNDGSVAWKFTAGGRVDSPPTIHHGLVLFGSADGSVYCLRATDGELVWQFRAAPKDLRSVAFEQVESLWPIHGSVLVRNGVAYAAAGRSSYLDGGIQLFGLDPASGRIVCDSRLTDAPVGATPMPAGVTQADSEEKITQNATDYKTFLASDHSDAFSMQGALCDIMSADETGVYMRHLRFDNKLNPVDEKRQHLFSTSYLLDDSEHHRSYWALGTGDFSRTPVAFPWIVPKSLAVPYGLMLAFDDDTVWGVRRDGSRDRKQGYSLFSQHRPKADDAESTLPDFAARQTTQPLTVWTTALTMRPRSLIRMGDALCVGGLAQPTPKPPTADDAGRLEVVSTRDGATRMELPLDAATVWDGLAATGDQLYASLVDGQVVCFGASSTGTR